RPEAGQDVGDGVVGTALSVAGAGVQQLQVIVRLGAQDVASDFTDQAVGATQAQIAQITRQAQPGLTRPEGAIGGAGVRLQSSFQSEVGTGAAAQVFRTLEAETRGRQVVGGHARDGLVATDAFQGGVDHTVQGDGRLSECGRRGSDGSQSQQSLFH